MNFFVKLSQNKKVIVPLVVLVGLGIFGSSYFIQDSRDTAKQETATSQTATEPQTDDFQATEPVQTQDELPTDDNPDASVSSDSSDDGTASLETVEVEIEVEGKDVIVKLSSEKPGECTLYAKNGNTVTMSRTITSSNSTCVFTNFTTEGAKKLQAQYHSSDQTAKGTGETNL